MVCDMSGLRDGALPGQLWSCLALPLSLSMSPWLYLIPSFVQQRQRELRLVLSASRLE